MSQPDVELHNVQVRFGPHLAVDDVTLEVEPGQFLALLGPSGAGKSTLLKAVGGQLVPDSGEILLGGEPIIGLPPNRIDCATVFQEYALFPHMTVRANVEFGLRMRKWDRARRQERAVEVLDMVDLTPHAERSVRQLSGGEKQRVATARALAVRPRVLLMDEPLGALDRLIKLRVQREVSDLLHQLNVTTLYVTHDQREALTMADRVAVIREGRLEQIGSPEELVHFPASHFVAEFLGGCGNYLPGTALDAPDAEGIVPVECALGRIHARVTGNGVRAGARVTVHVRPEELALISTGDDGMRVDDVSYTGEVAELRVRGAEDLVLTVKQLGVPTVNPGDTVGLRPADGRAVILPDGGAES